MSWGPLIRTVTSGCSSNVTPRDPPSSVSGLPDARLYTSGLLTGLS